MSDVLDASKTKPRRTTVSQPSLRLQILDAAEKTQGPPFRPGRSPRLRDRDRPGVELPDAPVVATGGRGKLGRSEVRSCSRIASEDGSDLTQPGMRTSPGIQFILRPACMPFARVIPCLISQIQMYLLPLLHIPSITFILPRPTFPLFLLFHLFRSGLAQGVVSEGVKRSPLAQPLLQPLLHDMAGAIYSTPNSRSKNLGIQRLDPSMSLI